MFSICTGQARPSRGWAITRPRGVGSRTTEIRPSDSILSAASRTVFRWELASCIRMMPCRIDLRQKALDLGLADVKVGIGEEEVNSAVDLHLQAGLVA